MIRPTLKSYVRAVYALDLLETAILDAPLADVLSLAAGQTQRAATAADIDTDTVPTARPNGGA